MEKFYEMIENGCFNGQLQVRGRGTKVGRDGKSESVNFDFEINFNDFKVSNTEERSRAPRNKA